jgi:hypothetical protein
MIIDERRTSQRVEIRRRLSERRNGYQFEPYSPPPREPLRAPPPICWKQSLQYTGLSPRGWKGTRASLPQLEQVALYIWRGPRSPP